MDVCVYSVFVLGIGLATDWSPVRGVLPTVLDQETEVKRSFSRMPYAPSGSNRNRRRRRRRRKVDLTDSSWDSLDGWSALSQGRYLYRRTQKQKKRGHTSLPRMGFEHTIPRAKTFHALDILSYLMPLFCFHFCCMLHYALWVCDVSVFFFFCIVLSAVFLVVLLVRVCQTWIIGLLLITWHIFSKQELWSQRNSFYKRTAQKQHSFICNGRETDNGMTSVARQQILNK
jgi:hypothetical protein